DRHRVAPYLAAEGEGVPAHVLELRLELGVRVHRLDEPGGDPLAGAVVRPDEDVGPLAGGRRLLELGRRILRALAGPRGPGVLGALLADGVEAVVRLVAVDPDLELLVLRRRAAAGQNRRRCQNEEPVLQRWTMHGTFPFSGGARGRA